MSRTWFRRQVWSDLSPGFFFMCASSPWEVWRGLSDRPPGAAGSPPADRSRKAGTGGGHRFVEPGRGNTGRPFRFERRGKGCRGGAGARGHATPTLLYGLKLVNYFSRSGRGISFCSTGSTVKPRISKVVAPRRTGSPRSPNATGTAPERHCLTNSSVRTLKVLLAEHPCNINPRPASLEYHSIISGPQPIQISLGPLQLFDPLSIGNGIICQPSAVSKNLISRPLRESIEVLLSPFGEKDLKRHADLAFRLARRAT